MSIFKRGIYNQQFLNALDTLYSDKNSFWYKMVNDSELFIAIRNESLNVYYNGQSLCKLSFNKRKKHIKGETHKKYLGITNKGYFTSHNGVILNEKSIIKNLAEIDSIKKNVKNHIGKEKFESYKQIMNRDKCVIDVEITLIKDKVPNPKKRSDYKISSIDYLSLEKSKLVFYEAKHNTNSEIRSRTTPKVFEQIERYEKELVQHENEILNSYKLVLQNLIDLNILKNKFIPNKFEINLNPFLIVFDVDKNESKVKHLQNLRKHFGERLILKLKQ